MRGRTWLAAGISLAGIVGFAVREEGVRAPSGVAELYDRLSGAYDLLASSYDWIDGRRLQQQAIGDLALEPGDTVVDLGTGTGWNLPYLADRVGPTGRVIGVDLSDGMLERARRRVIESGHLNVELVQGDLRCVDPPADTAAVLSAFALEMVPDHAEVVRRLADSLRPGSQIASVGLREPDTWPEWAVRLGVLVNRPFGVTPAYRRITPWTSIRDHLDDVTVVTSHAGAVYSAIGTVPDRSTV